MSQMNYFRRPQLVGKNLIRTPFALVRGSVRRSDADATSAVPYFPGVSVGQTIVIVIDAAAPITVTLTGNTFNTVLSDINTAISASGLALDLGGVLGIQSKTVGGQGSVSITGGSAAKGLGFDTLGGSVSAVGGDIPTTPESGNGNAHGIALLNKFEDVKSESIGRIASRLAANQDVLFADLMRGDICLKKVVGWTLNGAGTQITLPAGTKIFTGGPSSSSLSASSSREQLSAYYFLIDTATAQPAAPRVIAVANGTVVGSVPLANTASWAAADGGNILGQDVVKYGPTTINDITEGRLVYSAGGLFSTSGVVAGDFASISGATNLSEQDNNGYRWVVEQVISDTTISLRPMSQSEMSQMGVSVRDVQPVVELSSKLNGSEIFGTISIKPGNSWSKATLLLDQPLASTGSYELWISQPTSIRGRRAEDLADHLGLMFRRMASNYDSSPNILLSAPTITGSGTASIVVNDFQARWHGREIFVKGKTISAALAADQLVVWDETTGLLDVFPTTDPKAANLNGFQTVSPVNAGNASTGSHPVQLICRLKYSAPNFIVQGGPRLLSRHRGSLTVGWNGEFSTLEKAINYANTLADNATESSSNLNSGTYPHFDIVLVSDITVSSPITVTAPFLRIRGAQRGVRLILETASTSAFVVGSGAEFILENLTLRTTSANVTIVNTTDGENVSFTNCRYQNDGGGKPFYIAVKASSSGGEIKFSDSELTFGAGLVWGTVSKIRAYRSNLSHVTLTGVTTQQVFSSVSTAPSAVGSNLLNLDVDYCIIQGFGTDSLTIPVFMTDAGTGAFNITNSVIDLGGTLCLVLNGTQSVNINGSVFGNAFAGPNTAIQCANTTTSKISNSLVYCKPQAGSVALTTVGVQINQAANIKLTAFDSTAANFNCVGLQVAENATGCVVTGPLNYGIVADNTSTTNVSISNNIVNLTAGTNTPTATAGIVGFNSSRITNNYVSLPTSAGIAITNVHATNGSLLSIVGNRMLLVAGQTGIYLVNGGTHLLSSNFISCSNTSTIIGVSINGCVANVASNVISMALNATHTGIVINASGSNSTVNLTGNEFGTTGTPISIGDTSQTLTANGNQFLAMVNGFTLTGNVTFRNNLVNGVGAVTIAPSGTSDIVLTGNKFVASNIYCDVGAATGRVVFTDNDVVTGSLYKNASATQGFMAHVFSNNVVSGNSKLLGFGGQSGGDGYGKGSGNVFKGTCGVINYHLSDSHFIGAVAISDSKFSQCFFAAAVTEDTTDASRTAGPVTFEGCHFTSTISLPVTSSTIMVTELLGCYLSNVVTIGTPVFMADTYSLGAITLNSTAEASVNVSNCFVTGSALNIGDGTHSVTDAIVEGCFFDTAQTIYANSIRFRNNTCISSSYLLTVNGVDCTITDNYFNKTSPTLGAVGANINSTGIITFSSNRINANVQILSDHRITIIRDNRFATATTYALYFTGAFSERCDLTSNMFYGSYFTTGTAGAGVQPALVFFGAASSSANLKISDNHFQQLYTGNGTIINSSTFAGLVQINAVIYRIQILGNNFQLPLALTSGGFTWTWYGVKFDVTTCVNIVWGGNIVATATNTAPTPSQYNISGGAKPAYPGTITGAGDYKGGLCSGSYLYATASDDGIWSGAGASATAVHIP